ncbi:Conserved oligomeric Golgi complex subunit 7 [Lucilia cuprina]|nr:Conserved oligomeric Golgi complex subunit 7 [Lucilia cuprina]
MDISALSEDKFDAVNWINDNYKKYSSDDVKSSKNAETNTGGDTELAVEFINNYVSKLQLYVQQVNYAIEESSQQLVASMPRVVKDAKNLHNDVKELQQRMMIMRQEVAAVQEETGECMATLEERLNTMQTKLQIAKESLQESDGWGNLIAELEDSFERNDLKVRNCFEKSLQAQEATTRHLHRHSQVEDSRIVSKHLASPNVVQCFAEGSIEQAQRYVSIFAAIQRKPQLLQLLSSNAKQTLELQATETAGKQQHFLSFIYDQLLGKIASTSNEDAQRQPFVCYAELLPGSASLREIIEYYNLLRHAMNSSVHFNQRVKNKQLGLSIYEYFINSYSNIQDLRKTHTISLQQDVSNITSDLASLKADHLLVDNFLLFVIITITPNTAQLDPVGNYTLALLRIKPLQERLNTLELKLKNINSTYLKFYRRVLQQKRLSKRSRLLALYLWPPTELSPGHCAGYMPALVLHPQRKYNPNRTISTNITTNIHVIPFTLLSLRHFSNRPCGKFVTIKYSQTHTKVADYFTSLVVAQLHCLLGCEPRSSNGPVRQMPILFSTPTKSRHFLIAIVLVEDILSKIPLSE